MNMNLIEEDNSLHIHILAIGKSNHGYIHQVMELIETEDTCFYFFHKVNGQLAEQKHSAQMEYTTPQKLCACNCLIVIANLSDTSQFECIQSLLTMAVESNRESGAKTDVILVDSGAADQNQFKGDFRNAHAIFLCHKGASPVDVILYFFAMVAFYQAVDIDYTDLLQSLKNKRCYVSKFGDSKMQGVLQQSATAIADSAYTNLSSVHYCYYYPFAEVPSPSVGLHLGYEAVKKLIKKPFLQMNQFIRAQKATDTEFLFSVLPLQQDERLDLVQLVQVVVTDGAYNDVHSIVPMD